MPRILAAPLTEVMKDADIENLEQTLKTFNLSIPEQTDEIDMGYEIDTDEDSLNELMDALESEAAAAELYIPAELPKIIKSDDFRVYSLSSLIDALETVQETLDIGDDETNDDDNEASLYDEEPDDMFEENFDSVRYNIRRLWLKMYKFANDALENNSNLIIIP